MVTQTNRNRSLALINLAKEAVMMNSSLIVLCLVLVSTATCERLHGQIYSSIEGAAACFRRLNATHQAGCSSADGGAVGALAWVWDADDARWAARGGGGGGPYVAVVSTLLFQDVIETLITHSDNIAGIVLYQNSTQVPQYFSPESQCPNEYASASGSRCSGGGGGGGAWNPHGTALLRRDIPFPVFYLPAARHEELDKLLDCYRRFNEFDREQQSRRPLCSVQLSSFMFAAVNTEVCMRRSVAMNVRPTKQCDPLGDRNIHYATFPRGEEGHVEGNRSIVLVTARLDSASLFDGVSPGAASAAVGVVTLLAVARTLASMLPPSASAQHERNVAWALFSGESFDYIGSQRAAYDMSRGSWPPGAPLAAARVDLHLELGQLGGALAGATADAWPLTAFTPDYPLPDQDEINKFIDSIKEAEPLLSLERRVSDSLPPSSLHSFRRVLGATPARGGLAELLLTDHDHAFTNAYYHSVLDDATPLHFVYCNKTVDNNGVFLNTSTMISECSLTDISVQVKITRLANAVAKALYRRVTGEAYGGEQSTSAHLVDELLHCYLESASCRLLAASEYPAAGGVGGASEAEAPMPLYTSVHTWYSRAPHATGLLLALLTGDTNTTHLDECAKLDSKVYSFYWMNGWNMSGVCIQSTVSFADAISPAFTIPDYDYSSGLYSTWTESVWSGMWARVFVAAGGRGAAAATALGAIATLLLAALTYWLNRHAATIFAEQCEDTATISTNPSTAGILRSVNC